MSASGVSGVDGLEADILESNRELGQALPAIVLESAHIVEGEIARLAPRDTGALVAHLDEVTSQRQGRASATVQIEDSGTGGVEHYAIFQEFGTSKMAAHPFFRPGTEAARNRAESQIEDKIAEIIGRT